MAGETTVQNLLAIALPSDDYGDDTALAQLVNEALGRIAPCPMASGRPAVKAMSS